MRSHHPEVLSNEMVAGLFGVLTFHADAEFEDCGSEAKRVGREWEEMLRER